MAEPKKPLTKAQVMEMTGMSAKTFDDRTASAKAPQQDATWDKNARLAPSEGGGVSETFKRADASTTPLQPPVGGDPSMAPVEAPAARLPIGTYVALKNHNEL